MSKKLSPSQLEATGLEPGAASIRIELSQGRITVFFWAKVARRGESEAA
jgi:hypothetical protein